MRINEIEPGDIIRINRNREPVQVKLIHGSRVIVIHDDGSEQSVHISQIYAFWDKKTQITMTKQNFEQRYAAMNEKDRNTIMAAVYQQRCTATG